MAPHRSSFCQEVGGWLSCFVGCQCAASPRVETLCVCVGKKPSNERPTLEEDYHIAQFQAGKRGARELSWTYLWWFFFSGGSPWQAISTVRERGSYGKVRVESFLQKLCRMLSFGVKWWCFEKVVSTSERELRRLLNKVEVMASGLKLCGSVRSGEFIHWKIYELRFVLDRNLYRKRWH